jgi:hypothetical protein
MDISIPVSHQQPAVGKMGMVPFAVEHKFIPNRLILEPFLR